MINVRQISIQDLPALQTIGRKTFAETFAEGNSEENLANYLAEGFSAEKLSAELENKNSQFYFAETEGRMLGYLKVNTGNAQDANNLPIPKDNADEAFAAAACIGCGACVAACKNASAMLFTSAKVSQLALLPQGQVEAATRAQAMVAQMDEEGFGNCTNTGACEVECPKGISLENIARMNREYLVSSLTSEK